MDLFFFACADHTKDYGGKIGIGQKNYVRINLYVWNVTGRDVVVDPSKMTFTDASGKKPKPVKMLSMKDYVASIDRSQSWQAIMKTQNEEARAKAVATTGRSSANTNAQSSSNSQGSSRSSISGRSAAVGAAVSTNGVGGFVAGSRLDGSSNSQYSSNSQGTYSSQSASESVDARLYKENLKEAEENVHAFKSTLRAEREGKVHNYMKPTSIPSMGTYYGYILTRNTKLQNIQYDIMIDGYTYPFELNINESVN